MAAHEGMKKITGQEQPGVPPTASASMAQLILLIAVSCTGARPCARPCARSLLNPAKPPVHVLVPSPTVQQPWQLDVKVPSNLNHSRIP